MKNSDGFNAKKVDETDLLAGITVIDASQFLAGPYCSLRLMDLGARVIKIENPVKGDLCRNLYISDTDVDGDSTLFHAINRNKESVELNLKADDDLKILRNMLASADVFVQNFRPGVIERLGLDYDTVRQINPSIIYASISGYGETGEWVARPGQDLLAQARSGIMWLNGDADQGPVPFGLPVADIMAGATCAQGVLAGLVRKGISGTGCYIQTSLLEALIDFQFEVFTTYLNDGNRPPVRSGFGNAHAYLSAPYGVYATATGYIALAMTPVQVVFELMGIEDPDCILTQPDAAFRRRDEIKRLIAERFQTESTIHWLSILEPRDVWCAEVLDWEGLRQSDSFRHLDMTQEVTRHGGVSLQTTRSPIRVNGTRHKNGKAAPSLGSDNEKLRAEFLCRQAKS